MRLPKRPVWFAINLESKTECTIVNDPLLDVDKKIEMIYVYRGAIRREEEANTQGANHS